MEPEPDRPAVYWFLEKSVYSLIKNLAAKRQGLLVNGKRQSLPFSNLGVRRQSEGAIESLRNILV